MRIKFCLVILLTVSALISRAQCSIGFTYTHTDSLYHFVNTTAPLDTPAATITWSVQGPGISYQSSVLSPSFILPVNGTYYVKLQIYGTIACGGYAIDTIIVLGLDSSGTCEAAFSYYPTFATNFQFNDSSSASDSIVSYLWYGFTPPDSFIQVAGWTPNTTMSIWAYNGCMIHYYVVTHIITTVSGCQASVTDTIDTYCATCQYTYAPQMELGYDSIVQSYYLTDTGASAIHGLYYWQIGVGADSVIFSQDTMPYIGGYDSIYTVCVNIYDTARHCAVAACDTFNLRIGNPLGIAPVPASSSLLKTYVTSGSELIMTYSGRLPAHAEIYDIGGRLLLSTQVTDKTTTLDLSRYAAGSYILRLSSDSMQNINRKIMLEK